MKHQRYFGSVDASREALQTRALIGDLDRIVQILDVDIATEVERAGVVDCTRPQYPALARDLVARRDNLLDTIAALKQRLPSG